MMQKHEVINRIMRLYARRTPINRAGINVLYNRAHCRGYSPDMIYIGLETVIKKTI